MKIELSQAEYNNFVAWSRAFDRADRCKNLCYYHLQYIIPHSTLDSRMEKMWARVKELEPFPTFVNGTLTNKAAYVLNMIKLNEVYKSTNLFTIKG